MIRLLLALALSCAATLPAGAEVRQMEAKPGVSELRSACSTAKGQFDISPDGKGYACTTANCDGKGGSCTVACDNNNNCTGQTPSRLTVPTTLLGILQNGDMVERNSSGGGGGSLIGPGAPSGATKSDAPPSPVVPAFL